MLATIRDFVLVVLLAVLAFVVAVFILAAWLAFYGGLAAMFFGLSYWIVCKLAGLWCL